MFGRKAKQKRICVEGYDAAHHVIYHQNLEEVVLPERVMLELSMRYFNDPAPCEIHRAAVQKRAMMELVEFCGVNQRIAVEDLSEDQRAYLPGEAAFVSIREES